MKNKKLLYVLIPFVFLIWGMIIFKIFNFVSSPNDFAIIDTHQNSKTEKNVKDTFSIFANYRDPFFDKIYENTKSVSIQNYSNNGKTKSKNTIDIKVKPNIVYLGLIKNQKKNKQIALVQINGIIYNMLVGDNSEGVELLKIFKDSVEIRYDKSKFSIKK